MYTDCNNKEKYSCKNKNYKKSYCDVSYVDCNLYNNDCNSNKKIKKCKEDNCCQMDNMHPMFVYPIDLCDCQIYSILYSCMGKIVGLKLEDSDCILRLRICSVNQCGVMGTASSGKGPIFVKLTSIQYVDFGKETYVNPLCNFGTSSGNCQSTCPPGPKGDKGDMGPQGPKGDKGDKGDMGLQGSKGDKGDKGDMGSQGSKGDKGDMGDMGPQGSAGSKGSKGDMGPQGPKGDKGDMGPQGPAGSKGAKGDKGDMGPQGPAGICENCKYPQIEPKPKDKTKYMPQKKYPYKK